MEKVNPMIYWFFGYPGSGKDYCAHRFSALIGAEYFHADGFLTDEERDKLLRGVFTKQDRIIKLKRICDALEAQTSKVIAIADSLPDTASREYVASRFGKKIQFIFASVLPEIHKERLLSRKNHFFNAELLDQWVATHWDEAISIPHKIIDNNSSDIDDSLLELVSHE